MDRWDDNSERQRARSASSAQPLEVIAYRMKRGQASWIVFVLFSDVSA